MALSQGGIRLLLFGGAFSAVLTVSAALSNGQQVPLAPRPTSGAGVTPAFEGWYRNPDDTFTLLFGYLNRNHNQALDIPIGMDNRIEPGGPDRGQPTHFDPVALTEPRELGVFAVVVPKDFGSGKVTWTLTANGETNQVPGRLHPDYVITPFGEPAQGDTPPTIRFSPGGPLHVGPPGMVSASFKTSVSEPVTLAVWAKKSPPPRAAATAAGKQPVVTVRWSKYRGPGLVTFGTAQPDVSSDDGKAVTTAKFSAAGDYILRVRAMDAADRGSNQCCRTNALVHVTVAQN